MEESVAESKRCTSVSPGPEDGVVLLRRGDLAASVAASRAAVRATLQGRASWLYFAGMMASVPVSVTLVHAFRAAGWPDWLSLAAALTLGALMTITLIRMHLGRFHRILQHYQVRCPACDHELLDSWVLSGQPSVVDLTVQTGRCPHCAEISFAA